MRASPPFLVTVRRFGAWRAAVSGGLALAFASLLGWSIAGERPPAIALVLAWVAALPLFAAAAALLGRGAFTLRWDTQAWRLSDGTRADEGAPAGRLCVAVDLGRFMLLSFDRPPGRFGRRRTWLPVQRRGLEGEWHAFRCAVYSPRPDAGRDKNHASSTSRSRAESHA
jgi:hypothetical protein